MATLKDVLPVFRDLESAQEALEKLNRRRQELQQQLVAVNQEIPEARQAFNAAKQRAKQLLNEIVDA